MGLRNWFLGWISCAGGDQRSFTLIKSLISVAWTKHTYKKGKVKKKFKPGREKWRSLKVYLANIFSVSLQIPITFVVFVCYIFFHYLSIFLHRFLFADCNIVDTGRRLLHHLTPFRHFSASAIHFGVPSKQNLWWLMWNAYLRFFFVWQNKHKINGGKVRS